MNLVNIFCPQSMYNELVAKIEDFVAWIYGNFEEQQAEFVSTQVCLFQANWSTTNDTPTATVVYLNYEDGDGLKLKKAVDTSLAEVYPELWKKKRFVVLNFSR
ncbi:MAG: hypothetical protein MUP45_04450 [Candidatus Marinimicrobia bacterium]|nr:hypothetical protein [Candidatus Neomarinimicrobiota bacterium]